MADPAREFLISKRIGILMGGWSSERGISLRSGKLIYESLKRQGFEVVAIDVTRDFIDQVKAARIDIAFVILHGGAGEDGTIQACLEFLGIPYTGSGVRASAIGMDKVTTKRLFQAVGIPTPPYIFIPKEVDLKDKIEETKARLGLPLVLKPRAEGSSVGVELIREPELLYERCQKKRADFMEIFLERYIPGMMATVGILSEQALPVLEIVPRHQEFYDYISKYSRGETEFHIPARLEPKVYRDVQELALKAHQVVGCSGFSRVDIVVEEGKFPYLLEVNTLPGMTEISDLPAEAAHIGLSYDDLVYEILKSALPRMRDLLKAGA
jgi:D-alanine-D-alanine ligase